MSIGIVTAVVAFAQLCFDIVNLIKARSKKSSVISNTSENAVLSAEARVTNIRTAEIFGWMFGLFAAIWAVGFTFLVGPFILLYLRLTAKETWKTALIAAGVTGLIYWAFFDQFLKVVTPSGALIP